MDLSAVFLLRHFHPFFLSFFPGQKEVVFSPNSTRCYRALPTLELQRVFGVGADFDIITSTPKGLAGWLIIIQIAKESSRIALSVFIRSPTEVEGGRFVSMVPNCLPRAKKSPCPQKLIAAFHQTFVSPFFFLVIFRHTTTTSPGERQRFTTPPLEAPLE